MTRLALLLPLALAAGACDRFADEERRLVVAVVDADGQPVERARVYVVPRFDPPVRPSGEFVLRATAPRGADRVFYRVIRESTGASTDQVSARVEDDGAADIRISAADVGAGLFRIRYGQSPADAQEAVFALTVTPRAADAAPTTLLTGSDGTAELDLEDAGVGRDLDLTLSLAADGRQPVVRVAVTDTLDVVASDGERAGATRVAARPGLTRTLVTITPPQ